MLLLCENCITEESLPITADPLSITSTGSDLTTLKSSITIEGICDTGLDSLGISSGSFVDDDCSDGTWSASVSLSTGLNLIIVSALEEGIVVDTETAELFSCRGTALTSALSATGSGTEEDPFNICTIDQLLEIDAESGDDYYALRRDIDLKGFDRRIIGTLFGTFDGKGHTIFNFSATTTSASQAFVTSVSGGTVKNLTFMSPVVSGSSAATVAAVLNGGAIENVSIYDGVITVAATTGNGGGLVGLSAASTITNSSFQGSVSTSVGNVLQRLGGIVGYSVSTTTSRCYSAATISEGVTIGGIAGELAAGSTVSNSYTRGAVATAGTTAGGLVGAIVDAGSTLEFSFAINSVSAATNEGGAIASNSGTVSNVFYLSGQPAGVGGTAKTQVELKDLTTYSNFDFDNTWKKPYVDEIPIHQWEDKYHCSGFSIGASSILGSGTENDPYIICGVKQITILNSSPTTLAATYRLGAVVDFLGGGASSIGDGVGAFTGVLDGDNFKFKDFIINKLTGTDAGLFGELDGATVKNLYIEGAIVRVRQAGGILAGDAVNSTITNVHAQGRVLGVYRIGGLVGQDNGSTYSSVSTRVKVKSTSGPGAGGQVGGLIGNAILSIVEKSFSEGHIIGENVTVGGLIGVGSNTSVRNSYSLASVTGVNGTVGGLVGGMLAGSIENSFTTVGGVFDLQDSNVGGLVGQNLGATVSDSYFSDSSDNGEGTYIATKADMYQKTTFAFNNDFVGDGGGDLWVISVGESSPRLSWEKERYCEGSRLDSTGSKFAEGTNYGGAASSGFNRICTAAQWNLIADNAAYQDRRYQIMQDIDLDEETLTLIATNGVEQFTGEIDGRGYFMSHFTRTAPFTNYALFHDFDGTFKDLGMSDINLTSAFNNLATVSISAGANATIEDTYVTGNMQGVVRVSGISMGFDGLSFVRNFSYLNISGESSLSGLGAMGSTSIEKLYSYSEINGTATGSASATSGILGDFCGGPGVGLTEVYTKGNIAMPGALANASTLCSGIGIGITIDEYYSLATISAASAAGNIYGTVIGGATSYSNIYYENGTDQAGADSTQFSSDEDDQVTYAGWDFLGNSGDGSDDDWVIFDGFSYPFGSWE